MKGLEEYTDDEKLKRFFDLSTVEPAPPDFTAGIMSKIRAEAEHQKVNGQTSTKSFIPAVSALIIIILTIMVFLFPGEETGLEKILDSLFLKETDFPSLQLSFLQSFSASLPEWSMYIIVGITLLLIFDRILFRLFYRKANS